LESSLCGSSIMTLTSSLYPSGGGLSWSKITANTNAEKDKGYAIVASGDLTLTLPASPSEGDSIGIVDADSKATTHTLTVARNGNNIQGLAEDMVINTNRSGSILVYVDATNGWVITTEISVGNPSSSDYLGWSTENNVTTDQTPATTDSGEMFRFTSSTAADKSLTLPSVGISDDKMTFWIQNDSKYTITIKPSDSDKIWNSGAGYGIELVEKAIVCLRYNHGRTTWDIANKSGGTVRLEGLKLHLPCDEMLSAGLHTWDRLIDKTNQHLSYGLVGWDYNSNNSKFGAAAAYFNGSTHYVIIGDSSDWDVFGSTSGDYTVACWVYFDTSAGSLEMLLQQYEDGSNYWMLRRKTSGAIEIVFIRGGVTDININGGSTSSATWYHVALAKVNAETGLYVDGSQVAYDATFTLDTFAGSLNVGRWGSGADYLDGRMDDIVIANQNIYDANPNVGNTDTLSNWNQAFVGVQ